MNIQFKAFLWIILIYANSCFADILQTQNLEVVSQLLEQADVSTLVIFDVDDVLIAPNEEFAFKVLIRKKLSKKLKIKYSKNEIKVIFSNFFEKRSVKLVNPKIIDLINKLTHKNIPTTALTRWWTGKYGKIPNMEDLRFKGLNAVGISFIGISPFKKDCIFPNLKTDDGIPIIKNGIILTAFADKGLVLKAALNKVKLKFTRIIFIEDDLSQLQSVEKICKEMNIIFTGIHYTEANLIPLPVLNEQKERVRFQVLEQEHIWLLDEELEERLMLKDSMYSLVGAVGIEPTTY